MLPIVRRIVTGQSADGAARFTHVEAVEPIRRSNNMQWYGVWGWEEVPSLPHLRSAPYVPRSVFPAANGKAMRINTVVFPARYGLDTPPPAAPTAADAAYAKLAAASPPGGARGANGMHATDTVDLVVVQSGEISLIQGDGSEVTLRLGDVLVQNGTAHAWKNRTDQPCMICFIIMGAPVRTATASAGEPRE